MGVNSDASRQQLREVIATEKITWRSFWDGGSTEGPIASRWNIQGWPMMYVIDHEGVIVGQVGPDEKTDALIEEKVNKAQAALRK